jgi:hypothetical protein
MGGLVNPNGWLGKSQRKENYSFAENINIYYFWSIDQK